MNLSNVNVMFKAAMLTAVVAAAAMLMPVANAEVWSNTSGGTSCKGSSGFGATVFYFSNQTAQNTSTGGQYLTCYVPASNDGSAESLSDVQILVTNTTGAVQTFTCALQSGYELNGANNNIVTAIMNINVAANSGGNLHFTPSSTPVIPASASAYNPYTLTCLVPAGGKLGLIHARIAGTF